MVAHENAQPIRRRAARRLRQKSPTSERPSERLAGS
jgi:hypothetical protein